MMNNVCATVGLLAIVALGLLYGKEQQLVFELEDQLDAENRQRVQQETLAAHTAECEQRCREKLWNDYTRWGG